MIKIGVIMGGISREREISFAGGRTVYDNLDKTIFEAIPIFIDSFGNFILLNWQYVYKGSIRDFYPAPQFLPPTAGAEFPFQVYAESLGYLEDTKQKELIEAIGKKISLNELSQLIDFAFLTLHGAYGEEGSIQGLLHYLGIPYTASGILPSAIGMNKAFQKQCMQHSDFNSPNYSSIERNEWVNSSIIHKKNLYNKLKKYIKLPWVSRPANQGSSIGVHALNTDNFELFCTQINDAFFIKNLTFETWNGLQTPENEYNYVNQFIDFRNHLGFPLMVKNLHNAQTTESIFFHPQNLWDAIKNHFLHSTETLVFEALDKENEVIIEQFLDGKEFSCIVIKQLNGKITALPPTEIRKGKEIFDYRSKYLAGLSRKITPIELPTPQINIIRTACEKLFKYFKFNVYARIDGFINAQGTVFLNDPNTTSGMLPSSFFFHQAAEIGLNPSQFLTFIIYASIKERISENFNVYKFHTILQKLDTLLQNAQQKNVSKIKVGVFLGGYSSERHISVESGRNIFEKLSSSGKYLPIPLFVTGNDSKYDIFEIPINILLKDNADDIAEKIAHYKVHTLVQKIKNECAETFALFGTQNALNKPFKHSFETLKQRIDLAFIALHGRPGEDGTLQIALEKYGIAYNGSGIKSSQITIDKALTNQILKQNGYSFLAEQYIVEKQQYIDNKEVIITIIEKKFNYPFIAKPIDDGCSSAVKKIKNRTGLEAYLQLAFRNLNSQLTEKESIILELKPKEEFPAKDRVLLETLIEKGNAAHFLEITGGLLTHTSTQSTEYEMFEPSETLATNEVLSLEEKFLAGEGQNITPARYYPPQPQLNASISAQVQNDLKKAAKILNITGYCRIDAFVKITQQNEIQTFIIEANSLPGMTPATCIFHQAAINGYTPYEFINNILEEGKKQLNKKE